MKQFFKKHKRKKGEGEAPHPINFRGECVWGRGWVRGGGGEQHTLWPPNNPLIPIFSLALSMYSDDFKHKVRVTRGR